MKKNETIYERYRQLIASGAIAGGERLPSVREAAAETATSVNTILNAYERLADEGWIRARERSGYFARGRARLENADPAIPERFVSSARETGERLDMVFERLTRTDSSLAVAAPGTDLFPADRLEQAFGRLRRSWIEYAQAAGDPGFRKRIALASEETDGPTDAEDIVVTNGATEALSVALRTFVRPGDAVVLESPTYFNYFRQLAPFGAEIVEVPVGPDGMDLDMLEREIDSRKIRAIVAQPNVQNPSGVTMSDGAKARLAALAESRNIILIQDDVYGDLAFGPRRARNLSAFSGYSGIVLVSSYSKSIGPGLRIGWIRSPEYAERLAEEKLSASFESCRAAQFALSGFVATAAHRRHLGAMRRELEIRVDDHIALLSDLLPEGSSLRRPSGGCLLWIALPVGTDATAVFERSARKGLIAAPGEIFSSNPFFTNYLRINAGWKLSADRAKALSCLKEAFA